MASVSVRIRKPVEKNYPYEKNIITKKSIKKQPRPIYFLTSVKRLMFFLSVTSKLIDAHNVPPLQKNKKSIHNYFYKSIK
ncbi:hypothetical protein [Pectobacterium carotovorum]|uniref:hypothetical protein n=1 Tax=Pectobacterium carotovorum TaxID=554 RepID=UPI0011C435EF|nr:hypothetical protein [Pectobacterium carotovorum]